MAKLLVATGGWGDPAGTDKLAVAARGWGGAVSPVSVEPILTRIESAMTSLIDGMMISNGFFFDWGTVGQRDLAKVSKFPSAWIDIDEEEENVDGLDSAHANAYQNEVIFQVSAVGKLTSKKAIPNEAIKIISNRVLHDLKKIFGINFALLKGTGVTSIMYQGSNRIFHISGDIFTPETLMSRWRVRYSQSRTEPTEVAQ